uniref:Ribosomal RNA small subunit methyltransferase H n=1 Tax=Anthurium amnicola TaxID=1678845 RepID=A0A1D1ZJ66_9ARAE
MDPTLNQPAPPVEEVDEWDTDGFVIPSLSGGDSELGNPFVPEVTEPKPPSKAIKEEKIYLGPHGAPPSQAKNQDHNHSGHKQRFKNKLKEADRKLAGTGRENKVETLRELVGGKVTSLTMSKGSPRDWLDPHCHESQFERHSR